MARVNRVKSFRGTSKTADGTLSCGRCGKKIKKGDSYYWWKNRAPGSRGGYKQVRCAEHYPKPSETQGNPKMATLMAAQESAEEQLGALTADAEGTPEDLANAVQEIVQEAGESAREVADELREGAQNIEDGFGHATYQSEEMEQRAEQMESQADELDSWYPSATEPDLPEPDDEEADEDEEADDDEPEEERARLLDEYLEELKDEAQQALDENLELAY